MKKTIYILSILTMYGCGESKTASNQISVEKYNSVKWVDSATLMLDDANYYKIKAITKEMAPSVAKRKVDSIMINFNSLYNKLNSDDSKVVDFHKEDLEKELSGLN
ncbi:MAG: hypothetical protein ACO1NU_08655 [Arcticibacter sp.]